MALAQEDINAIVSGVCSVIMPLLRPDDDDMISPERAAQILNCEVKTLRRYVKAGYITDNNPGRGHKTLYNTDSVKAFRFKKINSPKLIK